MAKENAGIAGRIYQYNFVWATVNTTILSFHGSGEAWNVAVV